MLHLTSSGTQLGVATFSVTLSVDYLLKGGGLVCRKLMKSQIAHHIVKTIAVFIFATFALLVAPNDVAKP